MNVFCTMVELKINRNLLNLFRILDAKSDEVVQITTVFQLKLEVLLGMHSGMIIMKHTLCTFWLLNMKF